MQALNAWLIGHDHGLLLQGISADYRLRWCSTSSVGNPVRLYEIETPPGLVS
jgi:hypothetical protein